MQPHGTLGAQAHSAEPEIAIPLALLGRRRQPQGCCRSHKRRKNAATQPAKQRQNAEQHTNPLQQRQSAA